MPVGPEETGAAENGANAEEPAEPVSRDVAAPSEPSADHEPPAETRPDAGRVAEDDEEPGS